MRVACLSLLILCSGLQGGTGVGSPQQSGCAELSALRALPANPACPGPFEVATVEYDSRTAYPEGVLVDGISTPVDIWARVSYPSGFPAGPTPLILLLHGNQGNGTCPNIDPCNHHEGFQYLMDHLASQGFLVVSINANRLNGPSFSQITERAQLILEHLKRWRIWATTPEEPFGNAFVGQVDLTRIGLAGHSRGGEAVIAAYNLNRGSKAPFSIKAVLSFAPTDKEGLSIEDVPYYAVVPACDGDVLDYRGVRFFDRALGELEQRPSPKQLVLAVGANHNYFNSLWGKDAAGCAGVQLLERAQQETLAKALSAAFFRRFLWDETALHYLFTGDQVGPATPAVSLWISYADPAYLMLDDFSRSLGVNVLGGATTRSGLDQASLCGPMHAHPCSVAFVHQTPALALRWSTPAGAYQTQLPPARQDVRQFPYLSFRAAQNSEDLVVDGLMPQGTPLQFSVRLTDARGQTATVSSEEFAGVPVPIGSTVLDPQTGKPLRRTVLSTFRIPLAQFSGLDLSQLASVAFLFDVSDHGSLYLSHLQFSH